MKSNKEILLKIKDLEYSIGKSGIYDKNDIQYFKNFLEFLKLYLKSDSKDKSLMYQQTCNKNDRNSGQFNAAKWIVENRGIMNRYKSFFKEIPACKIRLIKESTKNITPIRKNDLRDAYKFLSDYTELPIDIFLNSAKKGKYTTLKIKDLLKISNQPWDNKRRPKSDSRLHNTIILAHIKSKISKPMPDYYLIIDGNHRVIQHINLNIPTINCYIIECPYIFLNKMGVISYDGDIIQENKLDENLRFSDLMKKASLSPFTLDYNKETNKLMGNPTNHTKLKSMRVNKKKDYVIFVWKTKRTPKYDNKKQPMKVVDPKAGFTMKPAKVYTIEIKVLDFFKLLHTKPDGDFTNKDIEDVFNVCDIQVWSNVPAFQYQGMNYHMTMFDASIYPEVRPPKVWNTRVSQFGKIHDENQFLDKHTAGVINSIKFYIPQMRMMIKKYMGLTKK